MQPLIGVRLDWNLRMLLYLSMISTTPPDSLLEYGVRFSYWEKCG